MGDVLVGKVTISASLKKINCPKISDQAALSEALPCSKCCASVCLPVAISILPFGKKLSFVSQLHSARSLEDLAKLNINLTDGKQPPKMQFLQSVSKNK